MDGLFMLLFQTDQNMHRHAFAKAYLGGTSYKDGNDFPESRTR